MDEQKKARTLELLAYEAIILADQYAGSNDSARVCIGDARACYETHRYIYAARRSRDSLAYSLGVFSDAYQRIDQKIKAAETL